MCQKRFLCLQTSSFKHVFPRGLELFLKVITLECPKYLSTGTWIIMSNCPIFPTALSPNGYGGASTWEMRDALDTGQACNRLTQDLKICLLLWTWAAAGRRSPSASVGITQLSERGGAASVSSTRMEVLPEAAKSWDLNKGCQAAKPIPIHVFLVHDFGLKRGGDPKTKLPVNM